MTAEASAAKKLASIVAIDVAGYSRRAEADEAAAIGAVGALRRRIAEAAQAHGGRVFNTAGDGFMLEFPTASGALAAAEEIATAADPPVRVGVHLGEVSLTAEGDLLGHGVNVAARLQQMAAPGAVLASGDVKRAIRGPLGDRLRPQGSVRLEKMSEVVPVFALASGAGGKVKGRRLKLPAGALALAALVVALVIAGGLIAAHEIPSGPPPDRIAVAPFSTLGGGDEVKTFATNMTDDLASVLSGNGRPIVTGADAQVLVGPDRAERARKLGVRLIFGGSVERQADQLKVRVQIDDPQHDVTLWTAALDAPASQSEQLQGRLGARIIAVLNCTARALRPKGGLSDPDAMTLLLKACDIFEDQVGMGDDAQSIYGLLDTCRQLVAKAPDFAAGHSLLAKFDAYYRAYLPPAMDAQLVQEARAEIRKALRIEPTDIDAHIAVYMLLPTADYLGRDRAIMPIPFDPSWPYGDIFKSLFLSDVGRLKESLASIQRAEAANPLSTDGDAATALAATGQASAAEAEIDRLARLWPARFLWIDRMVVYQDDGNWSALEATLDDRSLRLETVSDADVAQLKLVVAAERSRSAASRERARASLTTLPPGTHQGLATRIVSLSSLGYVDDAFALAARYSPADFNAGDTPGFVFSPEAAAMRRDPRFMPLMARWGLVDYWRTSGHWPDFCSEPGLPYDCKAEAAKLAGRPS